MEIRDLTSLLTAIDQVYDTFQHQPWWRGQSNRPDWNLVPSVHRLTDRGIGYEPNILIKFEQRALTRHPVCPASGDLARWLFLAQHYRLNTRLLDWTESPLVALYFAVASDGHSAKPGVLWALDPFLLNERQVGDPRVLQPGHSDADALITSAFTEGSATDHRALALLTHEVDLRMTVQLSAMTIHGSPQPLEARSDAKDYLVGFTVEASAKAILANRLERLGVRERSLYPDLQHLASDLNRDAYA